MTGTALPPALDSHTLLVAAVIVHDEAAGRVLLLQRGAGSKFAPLHWDLPSGKADKGEPVTAAAARELKEETGLTVDLAALRVAGIIHGAWGVEAPNGFLTVIFAARKWDRASRQCRATQARSGRLVPRQPGPRRASYPAAAKRSCAICAHQANPWSRRTGSDQAHNDRP